MSDQRLARLMGPAGLIVLVFVFLGFGPLGSGSPGENASGAAVVSWYNAHMAQSWASFYCVAAGIGVLFFYAVALRAKLRQAGAGSILSTTAFASGVALVAAVIASGATHVAIILAAHEHRPSVAALLNFIDQNNFEVILFGVVAMSIFTGAAILNRSSLPAWLGWVTVVIGVLSALGSLSFIGLLAWGIWLPVAGFVIGSHEPAAPRGAAPATAPQTLASGEAVGTV